MIRLNNIEQSRLFGLILAGISTLVLITAFVAQYGYDIDPCTLCIYQRYVHGAVVAIGLLLFLNVKYKLQLLYLMVFILFSSAVLAFFHVGVEQDWWEFSETCSTLPIGDYTVEELHKMIMARDPVPCDKVQWTILGFSMTVYNTILSLVLGFVSLWFIRRYKKGNHV